ncbi:ABC transporter substrate-binding protein [soil metagenome]
MYIVPLDTRAGHINGLDAQMNLKTVSPRGTVTRTLTLFAGATLASLVLAGCTSGSPTAANTSSAKSSYKVGVLLVAQAQLLTDIETAFEKSVTKGMGGIPVSFDVKNANGDPSLISSISRDLASSDDDAFAVIGTPAVVALSGQVTDRPVFALAMGDPVGAGVAKSLDAPGGNVTGSTDFVDPDLVVKDVLAIQPTVKTIGTVYDPSNQNMQVWVDALKRATDAAGLTVTEATISSSADVSQSARSLVGRADAVLIGPDATVIAGMDAVSAAAAGASMPLYVSGGDASVAGVLASIGANYPSLGTSAGENAAKVLLGADVATTPFAIPTSVDLTINGATMKTLDITIPADVLAKATVL